MPDGQTPPQFDFSKLESMVEPDPLPADSPIATMPLQGDDEPQGSENAPLFQAAPKDTGTQENPTLAAAPKTDPEEDKEEPEDILDILESKAEPHEWTLGPEQDRHLYVQRPLSFLGKMQWFSLVGNVLDEAMGGERPVSINELLEAPDRGGKGTFRLEDFRDADTFVRGVSKLIYHAPNFLTDSFNIWLGVEPHRRELMTFYMGLSVEEGGLSDEMGFEMIEVFIDQNMDALQDFFGSKIAGLQKRVAQRTKDRADRKRR